MEPPNLGNPVWNTKAGNRVPVSGMASTHIFNTLKYLLNKSDEHDIFLAEFFSMIELQDLTKDFDVVSENFKYSVALKQWIEVFKKELNYRFYTTDLTYTELVKATERRNQQFGKRFRNPVSS